MSLGQFSSGKMSAASNSLLAIPAEIQLEIFSYLDEGDLQSALYLCCSLYATARACLIRKNAQNSASALYWACFNGDLSLATQMLMLGAPVNANATRNDARAINPDLLLQTPLVHAIAGCHPAVVELLVSHGANVNADPIDPVYSARASWYPIHWAAGYTRSHEEVESTEPRKKIIDSLLRNGASVWQRSRVIVRRDAHRTPLLVAFGNPEISEDMVAHILERGASAGELLSASAPLEYFVQSWRYNAYDAMTKGHRIYHTRNTKKLELLLLNGAVHQTNADGESVLLRYIQQVPGEVEIEMARLFLKHGLNVNALNKHGQTLLTVAVSCLQDWCLRGKQPRNTAALNKVLSNAQSLFELLLDAGANPNGSVTSFHLRDSRGINSIPSASSNPSLSSPLGALLMQTHPVCRVPYFLRFFLDRAASALATDENNLTPLHIACLYDQAECITELLARGASANVNTPDNKGWTPLALVCGATYDAALKWKRSSVYRTPS
ncbi:hypothetical protein DL771_000263 [Monosporascus sp. 5C6A]|nr:hypothetical protein DL771_000263 [Monosporascus sp. 5C6A]